MGLIRKTAMAASLSALLIGGTSGALITHKNHQLGQIASEFPVYVHLFEQHYGLLCIKPDLEFKSLEMDILAETDGYTITINNSLSLHIFLLNDDLFFFEGEGGKKFRKSIIDHELAHIYTDCVPKEDNTVWTQKIGRWKFQRRNTEVYTILDEGIAEYIALNHDDAYLLTESYTPYLEFVKPVLNHFGIEEGIRQLFAKPPAHGEFENPQMYYQRIGLPQYLRENSDR